MKTFNIRAPLSSSAVEKLEAGDQVFISGVIYTARDAAHKRIIQGLERNEQPPFDLKDQVLYYTGPTPARPGHIIGSAGPTTSGRMDIYTPRLLQIGLKGMIGKGNRSKAVKEAITRYKAVYLAALGGAGALISKSITMAEVIAYADLGTEAVFRLEVENLPAVVINDIYGRDWYEIARSIFSGKSG